MPLHQGKFLKLRPQPLSGFIYLVQAVGTNKFKIGRATDVIKRIQGLQTGSPLKIRYVYHAYVHNANLCEMELHNKFSYQREIGEWFALTSEDVKSCILLMRLIQEAEPTNSTPEESAEESAEDELFVSMPLAVVRGEEKFRSLRLNRDLTLEEQVLAERIMNLEIRGYGKAKIILELWGVNKGGSAKYKAAEAEYKRLVEESA